MVFNPKFGAFNKQITFSTITKVDDGFGGFTATFSPYATVWAYVKPLSMNEQLVRGQEAGTTTYDVWVQATGDYNFTRQMKVTYNGKEFVINSIVEQDEDDRYFQFSMSSKDDTTIVIPRLLAGLTGDGLPQGIPNVYLVWDVAMIDPTDSLNQVVFSLIGGTTFTTPISVAMSSDAKTMIFTLAEDDIQPGWDVFLNTIAGTFESVAGVHSERISNYPITNNIHD